ncbi:hypothetical protein RND81_03G103000 [Saponaria officinalis]|uniref:Uncharacterized protein n=1 Tax=Saponaria officinalis TaxID=3572 RepID=A0AAW1M2L9_SAPOF
MTNNFLNELLRLLVVVVVTVVIGVRSSIGAENVTVVNNGKPGCQTQCGNLTIPYPFGIGTSCSINPFYSLECDDSYNPPRAFTGMLNSSSTSFRVFQILETELHVNGMIAYKCPPSNGTLDSIVSSKGVTFLPHPNSPFTLSSTANFFSMAGSCDYVAPVLTPRNYAENITCRLSCYGRDGDHFEAGVCSFSNGCCKRPIRYDVEKGFSLEVELLENTEVKLHSRCGYVFVGMEDSLVLRYASDYSDPAFVSRTRDNVVMVVDWVVGNQTCHEARRDPTSYACLYNNTDCVDAPSKGYRCACRLGYQGNPYLPPGCTDKNECAAKINPCNKKAVCNNTVGDYICTCPHGYHGDGRINGSGCIANSIFTLLPFKLTLGLSLGLLFILVIGSGTHILIRKHKLAKTREKFFKQNGGLMLQEKLSSSNIGSGFNSFKIFTMDELKKATKNFSQDLIVGIGGYGTVYKGTLHDGNVVAVKVSKMVDDTQIEQFINEMVILTQIHHRNVVKLLGCCLEAEIPILVYEFIANGSLLQHIHGESSRLSWKNRLRIATEAATALGYLHSATSTPIIHRDIKSANILLDENYGAKISDFGASRLIPMDKTQMSTLVQGTLGYMDPEYLLSSQLTDKSDVYGFGVVVAELLTGEKPLSTERRMGERNLAKYFANCFKQGRVLDIIDPRIFDEAPQEQLRWVAEIIHECLDVKGANRPMMKDVAIELAGIQRKATEMSDDQSNEGNMNSNQDEVREAWNSQSDCVSNFSFTIEPR